MGTIPGGPPIPWSSPPSKPTRCSTLQSLLPGTLLEGVTLTELPPELYYLPEVPLSDMYGEDAFGVWTLEIWDNRVGPDPPTMPS